MDETNVMLEVLAHFSNKYGKDPAFVLAGGGNTSYKNEDTLYIKGSGTALATIRPEDFVTLERPALEQIWTRKYPDGEKEREAAFLADLMDARTRRETRRPSVETLLHELFPQKFVLHVHPTLVNGLTCSKNGEAIVSELFPEAVWIPVCKPGYILAMICKDALRQYSSTHGGADAQIIFLQNHGIFFAADSEGELDKLCDNVMSKLKLKLKRTPDLTADPFDRERAAELAPAIRMLYGSDSIVTFFTNRALLEYDPATKSLSPDHIVYTKANPLILDDGDVDVKKAFNAYVEKHGCKPKIVYVKGLGAYACGSSYKEASTAMEVYLDAVKISVYAESFGGVQTMPDELIDFIVNWEVESYRSKVSNAASGLGRLHNKIAIVTGGAQGFGLGIATAMAEEGAYVAIADMNYEGAQKAAEGIPGAFAIAANVTDEVSVKAMIEDAVIHFGGLDIFVNNAGVVKAGSLDEMQKSAFEFVASVNYTGYFLCAKYASKVMKLEHSFDPSYTSDIIEINSKSGLAGSNKNFAYAGSKFGGIGLTQSFALELAPYNIKVNAICPGNFLDGPLWSDPVKGLFVQYLNAGKVPGAKDVADVRRYYESKVPLGRGCETLDVARAIFYIVEQKYETGQAVPVTGGQEMLN